MEVENITGKKEKNLQLWKLVEKSDLNHTRQFEYENGKKLITIDAYYQIKVATAIWGSYGGKWGFKKISVTQIGSTALYKAVFSYPGGEFEIINSISIAERDFAKKLETDTLTKALSRLGFNADIFMGKFDDSKYIESLKHQNLPKSTDSSSEKPAPASANQTSATAAQNTETETPDIAAALKQHGLNLIVQNGIYVVQGQGTYTKKSVIKSLGFQYSSEKKAWWKQCSAG